MVAMCGTDWRGVKQEARASRNKAWTREVAMGW